MKLLAGTEEGKVCTVKYTVYQTWLCVCMRSCFDMIGIGYKPVWELFEQSFVMLFFCNCLKCLEDFAQANLCPF